MDNTLMKGEELQTWRVEHGYSQSQLAEALGVITLTVSRWETGGREIPPFLHLALKSLPRKEGEIRRGRPATKDCTTGKKRKKKGR